METEKHHLEICCCEALCLCSGPVPGVTCYFNTRSEEQLFKNKALGSNWQKFKNKFWLRLDNYANFSGRNLNEACNLTL